MVRTLTRSPKDQPTVLLPGATEAEPWEAWTTGAGAQCLQVSPTPMENRAAAGATLALPVAQVVALPLWLLETDPRQFRGMIALQLEARGLQPRGGEPIFDWSIIAEEPTRTLVLVGILPASLPEELETAAFPAFEVSPRCLRLPEDALVVWTEQDRLVTAITRGDRLAYFHSLPDGRFTNRVLQDLTCLVASLRMQGVTANLQRVVLWTEATAAEIAKLQSQLGLPVRQEARPAPSLPVEPWQLTPRRVFEVKRQRAARRWWTRLGGLAALLLVAAVLALGLRLFLVQRDVAQLKKWQAGHADALQMVHQTQAAWHELQPVVARDSYPLEVLLHTTASLPSDQVHLTLFEAEGNHVLIKAEAKNLTAAFQFFDALKKNPDLPGYAWEMAQPQSLANDVTQIQIEGTHAIHD
jgi:hypothetical protein